MKNSKLVARWGLASVLSLSVLGGCAAGEELEQEVEEEELEDAIEDDLVEPVGELEEEVEEEGVEDAVEGEELDINDEEE